MPGGGSCGRTTWRCFPCRATLGACRPPLLELAAAKKESRLALSSPVTGRSTGGPVTSRLLRSFGGGSPPIFYRPRPPVERAPLAGGHASRSPVRTAASVLVPAWWPKGRVWGGRGEWTRVLMGRPSKFPPEVREQAVELVRAIGKTVAEVARDLQMNDTTLGSWVRADRAVPAAEGHPLGLLRLAAPTALGQSGRRRDTDHPDPHRLERSPFRLTVAHLR